MPGGARGPSIGELRNLVQLQLPVETADSHGGKVVTYPTTLASVWAAIWPISGREAVLAQQTTTVLTTTVWIRYRTDFSVKGRIVFGSRTLQVEALNDPDGRRAFLRLLCSEVVA